MSQNNNLEACVRAVLVKQAKLTADAVSLGASADLYEAGMSSHASVNVMLALESELAVEFPDEMLKRSVFASIRSICDALASIERS